MTGFAADYPQVIGLDLSLTATGFCYPDGSTNLLRPKDMAGMRRLAWLRDEVFSHFAYVLGRYPDIVVIEGYAMGTARQSHSYAIGELGGIIRLALTEAGVPYVDVPPATLKKYATGKGNATKPDMRSERLKRTGVDERDDNLNDAWWLRQTGLCWFLDDRPDVETPIESQVADYHRMPKTHRAALSPVHFTHREPLTEAAS